MDRLVLDVRRRWYGLWFLFWASARCRRLKVGEENRFNVPVRGESSGFLEIGPGNSFGYRPAPRLDSGQILIQGRLFDSEIVIGSRNSFSNNINIIATQKITIGNDCLIGDQVLIIDSDFHSVNPDLRRRSAGPSDPVQIGNNVWLGSRVMILKGVSIGDNSVIGAMSLVKESIPANSIVAGNPARIIGSCG
jgi:maltose O-acetyltransferase